MKQKISKTQTDILKVLREFKTVHVTTSFVHMALGGRYHRRTIERNLKQLYRTGLVSMRKEHYRSNVQMNTWSISHEGLMQLYSRWVK